MEHSTAGTASSQPSREIPPDLLKNLHEANARFHQGKQSVEEAMKSTEYDFVEHVEEARKKLQEAETAVEEVTRKINEAMEKSGS